MKLYFCDSQIPELKGFNARSRYSLMQLAIQNLKADKGYLIFYVWAVAGVFGVGIGSLFSPVAAAMFWPTVAREWFESGFLWSVLACVPGAVIGGGIMGFFGKQLVVARLRPYLRKLVEEAESLR